jgi:hypothetical protein
MDAYDADDEYEPEPNEGYDIFPHIDRQVFVNIGVYMFEKSNESRINMDLVLSELVTLHRCRKNSKSDEEKKINNVGVCRKNIRSVESELFSLCSNETEDTIFKYYVSDDDINIEI